VHYLENKVLDFPNNSYVTFRMDILSFKMAPQQTDMTGTRNCTKTDDKTRRFVDKTKKHVKLLSTSARPKPIHFL